MAGQTMPLDDPHEAVAKDLPPDKLLDAGSAVSADSVLCGQDSAGRSWLLGGKLSEAVVARLERPLPRPRCGWRRWRRRRDKRAIWLAAQAVERGQLLQPAMLGRRAEQRRAPVQYFVFVGHGISSPCEAILDVLWAFGVCLDVPITVLAAGGAQAWAGSTLFSVEIPGQQVRLGIKRLRANQESHAF